MSLGFPEADNRGVPNPEDLVNFQQQNPQPQHYYFMDGRPSSNSTNRIPYYAAPHDRRKLEYTRSLSQGTARRLVPAASYLGVLLCLAASLLILPLILPPLPPPPLMLLLLLPIGILGMLMDHGRYLGCPSSLSRNKKASLNHIKTKVQKVLQGWKGHFFSTAGKEVLIKAVAQAIPTYTLTCFKLPQGCCHDLNRLVANFWWGSSEQGRKIHWLNWASLTKPKDRGGLGFRDIRAFNQALLAKHTWRILKRPQSLVATMLKARYFPRGDFLTARLGGRPSYVWRGILWGRELAIQGGRWRVGNGESIDIYVDQWIPREKTFKILSKQRPLNDRRVQSLFDGNQSWNVELLEDMFIQEDVEKILDIPIAGSHYPDTFFWHYDRKGIYSVRSGYKLAMDISHEASSSDNNSSLEWWKTLWNINVPSKIKIFIWRASLNILPTKMNLLKRCIECDQNCPRCKKVRESTVHALWDCKTVKKHWAGWSPVQSLFQFHYSDMLDLFCRAQVSLQKETMAIFVTTMWALWMCRNTKVFNGPKNYGMEDNPILWAASYVDDFMAILSPASGILSTGDRTEATDNRSRGTPFLRNTSVRPLISWVPPINHQYKLNVDAAVLNGKIGMGAIIRNSKGEVMATAEFFLKTRSSVEWAEAKALVEGVHLAHEVGLSPVWAEVDSKLVWNLLTDQDHHHNEIEPLIDHLQILFKTKHILGFLFTPRGGNEAAHTLATHARQAEHSEVWIEDSPPWVHHILRREMATPNTSITFLTA